ncbi:MAG: glycoside hydrolase family 127 protein [Spirochaetota bacterium]
MAHTRQAFTAVPLGKASITGGFWADWQRRNREITVPYVLDMCDETGRTDSLRLAWSEGADWQPHPFYDSDIAKALEAAAYSLHQVPDADLEARVDGYVELFARAQQPDGYLNSYYAQTGIEKRWTNLRDMHELYCAGHLFEAAVAYERATGKRELLDVSTRYADHIAGRFGPPDQRSPAGEPKEPGYPGHEEIELALVKLAEATGNVSYRDLARFFVDERGGEPHYFRVEAERRGEAPENAHWDRSDVPAPFAYYQAHAPVREQQAAEGHSVRACYLYAGMADVATATGDETLLAACRRLFANIASRRMYVTGGVGSHAHGERFTFDYDLPNESAYAETCAAISLVFFASRMANIELDSRYADVAERALYNGVLGGLGLDGKSFFYANPLAYHPTAPDLPHVRSDAERRPWYGCACCPPNIARLLASLAGYVYATGGDTVAVHHYASSALELDLGEAVGTLRQETNYPWDGEIAFTWDGPKPATFTLAMRIPSWAGSYALSEEGAELRSGYLHYRATWQPGDTLRLSLPMEIRRTAAHPAVRQDGWQVALERGPIVYCLEQADNGADLADLALPADAALRAEYERDLLGGCTVVRGTAVRRGGADGGPTRRAADTGSPAGSPLYGPPATRHDVAFTAVPFALRANRGPGEMRVWIAEG